MGTIFRLLVVAVVLVVAFVVLDNTWAGAPWREAGITSGPVGTSGSINADRAREVGADIGEKAAVATQQVKDSAHDAAITTKIKAKMALDEQVRARAIDVSTDGSTVSLSGSVASQAERERAVALARETAGVTEVFDRLVIK